MWGTQIEGTREDDKKIRDVQQWKKVIIKKHPKKFGGGWEQSQCLRDPDIGPGNQPARFPAQEQPVRVPQRIPDREDIRTRLHRHPNVIIADTPANRASRRRRPPVPVYVPEVRKPKGRKKLVLPNFKKDTVLNNIVKPNSCDFM